MIRPQTCPICRTELAPETGVDSPHFPFCSKRCRDVDLLRWTEGEYAVVDPVDPSKLSESEFEQAFGELGYDETGFDQSGYDEKPAPD